MTARGPQGVRGLGDCLKTVDKRGLVATAWAAGLETHRHLTDLSDAEWERLEPPLPPGFHVVPRGWVVERTFAWIGRQRRQSKDYERLAASAEAWIYLAMIRLMLRRLARF